MEALYAGLKSKIAWEDVIDKKGYFSIASYASHPSAKNAMYVNQRCKDAVADYFRERYGIRPDAGKEKDRTVLFVHWDGKTAGVYVDTSGEPLDKRGYRLHPYLAPVQETLAAACLAASGWDGRSALVNPMCGSGTLAIEAALLAAGKAPGLLRKNFGFMHVVGYDASAYENERRIAMEAEHKPPAPIVASDQSALALDAARKNAAQAGVEQYIRFEQCDYADTPVPEGPGTVLVNPPYGERLGEAETLAPLYAGLGDFFKRRCAGKSAWVLSGNTELAKHIRLQPFRRVPLMNGKIECRLLGYAMYEGSRRGE
jgi:putative N6-adenine-specific DNA methylase